MATGKSSSPAVIAYISELPEPLRTEVSALRQVILASEAGIGEEIKWNAPSFYKGVHFATMRLHGKVPLQLILHFGVKKTAIPKNSIKDPAGLLRWLGPDRACVNFVDEGEAASSAGALRSILKQWVKYLPKSS